MVRTQVGVTNSVQLTGSSAVDSGSKDVASAGTPVALVASSTPCYAVLVRAKAANTGSVYVGKQASPTFPLAAGEAVEVRVGDVATVYIDADVNGEGVSWLAETP